MSDLERITTEYVESEDRVRLSGALASGDVVVLWLTHRLLSRLVPHLCGWLHKQSGAAVPEALAETVQGFAQQAAMAALEPAEPVKPASGAGWLVESIDVSASSGSMALHFKAVPDGVAPARLTFAAQPLRQWLTILHGQFRRADWPLTVWPDWVAEGAAKAPEAQGAVLH